jgi:hypothetical protein
LLSGVSELLNGPESALHSHVEGASKYQRQVTSALCVLANMVEHHSQSATCIAQVNVQDSSERNASGNGASSQRTGGASTQGESYVLSDICESKASDQTSLKAGKEDARSPPSKIARLAAGSRRRRINGDKRCTSPSHPAVTNRPANVSVHSTQEMSSTMTTASMGSFMRMCCEMLQKVWKAESCKSQNKQQKKETSNLGFLKLYLAIFLGVVVHGCPEVQKDLAATIDVARVVEDMESGLQFYVTHGAMEKSSEKFLQSAIDSLNSKCM